MAGSEKEEYEGYLDDVNWKPYLPSGANPAFVKIATFNKLDRFLIFTLCTLGVFFRLYRLHIPKGVVFDEVHFGGFANQYFNGEFFIDVHPPLLKLVYYIIGWLVGWDGEFDFSQIATDYDASVPYVYMRLVSAICGVFVIVLSFGTLRLSGCRHSVAFFGALLITIENSLITQSRFILLDGPLIFGIALVMFCYRRFQLTTPFSRKWYKVLISIGMSLGILISMKLSSLYSYIWFGIITIFELWRILGDLSVSDKQWAKHFILRVKAFIFIPLSIYLGIFWIHLRMLSLNGNGSGMVSPNFRASFADSNDLKNVPVQVSYGSAITIKSNSLEGYLHSHDSKYESGTGEQQVSMYDFTPDDNNEWVVETRNSFRERIFKEAEQVKDGDIVRLFHKHTGKYLHVSDMRPPVSEHDYSYEVSCNESRGLLGNEEYEFRVRILLKKSHSTSDLPLIKLRATESIFQLVHQGTKCVLMTHSTKLPSWGFGQREVLCVDEPTIPNSLWYIEHNSHPQLDGNPEVELVKLPRISFWRKLWEYHKAVFRNNKETTDSHPYESTPETWPFLFRGVNYYGNDAPEHGLKEGSHVYYLGNLAIYYLTFTIVIVTIIAQVVQLFKLMNPYTVPEKSFHKQVFYDFSRDYVIGWTVHYYPYFLMSRQLFLHHYLPALYFGILLLSQFVEYQTARRKVTGYLFMISILVSSLYCFVSFSPLIYGTEWGRSECNHSKWFSSWDFNCMNYPH